MKRLSLLMLSIIAGSISFGQTMKDVIVTAQIKRDYPKAKESIDKVLADPKNANDPQAYYWKGYIYYMLGKDPKTKGLCADCKMESFNALKKYYELDPSMKETKTDSNSIGYDLFYTYYGDAVNHYNNTKNYDSALTNFKNAIMVQDYLYSKNLIGPGGAKSLALDTNALFYAGLSARQVNKEDESIQLFKKIIDAGITSPQYQDIYELALEYYKKNKNEAMLSDVIAKGKKAYPNDDYWYQVEIEQLPKSDSREPLFAKYEEQVKTRPNSFFINYNYAIELYKYVYNNDSKPADLEAKRTRLTEVINNAMASDTTGEANVLMAKHLDYYSSDLGDAAIAVKGAKPEDIKKRNDLKAQASKKADESIVYAETANKYYSESKKKLTNRQKSNYRDVLQILSRYYANKKDEKKALEYDQKKAGIDKM